MGQETGRRICSREHSRRPGGSRAVTVGAKWGLMIFKVVCYTVLGVDRDISTVWIYWYQCTPQYASPRALGLPTHNRAPRPSAKVADPEATLGSNLPRSNTLPGPDRHPAISLFRQGITRTRSYTGVSQVHLTLDASQGDHTLVSPLGAIRAFPHRCLKSHPGPAYQ
jgi:hypothetical protein